MKQTRGYVRRSIGAIDDNIQLANPVPSLPPWVTGRFYESFFAIASASTGTGTLSSTMWLVPHLVPNDIVLTSIGIEITGAGTAGALLRFGIYSSDSVTNLPKSLVLDGGTTVGDATGYQSVAVSKYLRAGLYWAAMAASTPTTYPTVRVGTNVSLIMFSSSDLANNVSQQIFANITVSNIGPSMVSFGFSAVFFPMTLVNSQSVTTAAPNPPRIMLGV